MSHNWSSSVLVFSSYQDFNLTHLGYLNTSHELAGLYDHNATSHELAGFLDYNITSSNGNRSHLGTGNATPSTTPPTYTNEQIKKAFFVTWVFYPILLALCTVGNVLNLIVLFHEKPKGSTNVYMTSVAIADLFVLWLFLPLYLRNISPALRATPSFIEPFKRFYGLQIWWQETFILVCDWTLIAFSLARLLVLVRPFSWQWIQTARTSRIVITVLLVLSLLFTVYNPVQQYYLLQYNITSVAKGPQWLITWSELQHQADVAMTIVKFFALLVINCMVIWAIGRQQKSDVGKMRAAQANSKAKYRSSNLILLGSVILYLTTQFPSLVVNCLYIAADDYKTYDFPRSVRLFVNPFVNISFLTNYSVNFFLYLTVSERFRAQFMEVLGKKFCPTYAAKYTRSSKNGGSSQAAYRNGQYENSAIRMKPVGATQSNSSALSTKTARVNLTDLKSVSSNDVLARGPSSKD
ncbi:hypothetical protein RvY_10735 [Ramazzottius varieornatus]|uniref:G-protein coupled receptors family 1 profile domain-containing protein n=1 Tax=Ramazzottius varieornatus TaxID=947166 RepID=A0A1D1VLJ4_RAMVA|nr:hypothetical protein RvY_10735 [Ramazzottius varieornatus]